MERGEIRKWAEHREKERLKRKLATYTCAHYYQYRHVIKFLFRLQEIEEVRISNEYLSNLLHSLFHMRNNLQVRQCEKSHQKHQKIALFAGRF